MKSTGAIALALALVPRAFAFFPYTPDWCNGGTCVDAAIKRTEGTLQSREAASVEGIPTLKLHRHKTRQRHVKRGGDIVESSDPTLADSTAVDEDSLDYSYFADMYFGSSGTPISMLIDTGSFMTWAPSTSCKSDSCINPTHSTFGPQNSTTLNSTDEPFSVTYGTGSVDGTYASDSVSFAGLKVDLTFGSANETSDDFNNFPFDGILSLGNLLTFNNQRTFMGVVTDNKLLQSNLFGVNLGRASESTHDGEINFGAPDTTKYNGSLVYSQVIESSNSWSIALDDASYDGKTAGFVGKEALIDTGTSYVILPSDDAAQLFSLIPNATLNDAQTTYMVACDIKTPIQFTFSGTSFNISAEDWVGPVMDSKKNLCASNIYPVDGATSIKGQWLLGDTFLKNVYSVFDFDLNRIGFGAKSGSSISTETTPEASGTSTASPLLPSGASSATSTSTSSSHSGSSTGKIQNSSAPIPLPAFSRIATILGSLLVSFAAGGVFLIV